PLPGTERAVDPFFSTDGKRIGFTVGPSNTLEIVGIDGAAPVAVVDSLLGQGGDSWAPDGSIYADANTDTGILHVPLGSGASPKLFTTIDSAAGELDHEWPEVLPNGKAVLFSIRYMARGKASAIAIADISSGEHRLLLADGNRPVYTNGYIVYLNSANRLMAVSFDQDHLRLRGAPIA